MGKVFYYIRDFIKARGCYFALLAIAPLSSSEFDLYFLTYPRCGTHWLMYCIGHFSHRECRAGPKLISYSTAGIEHDPTLPPYRHTHFHSQVEKSDDTLLILQVRNYKECMIRHHRSVKKALQNISEKKNYFENLKLYDSWDPERRLLVYYEDLILHPKQTLTKVLKFLDCYDEQELEEFLFNIAAHRRKVLQFYKKYGGARSKGKDLTYHSKDVSDRELQALDDYAKKNYPNLWKKYLWMYAQ
ncbi:MAG: sulfotransferase domain-containing protein [Candidatus Algichlamydia australiensis]|nr:sulfotransferase domain-containing protein [Chlamydiales bacterium]